MDLLRFAALGIIVFAVVQGKLVTRLSSGDVTAILNELVDVDENGAGEEDIAVDYQMPASPTKFDHDNAKYPLFKSASADIIGGATFKAFEVLQALYTKPDIETLDVNSPERENAAKAFIEKIMGTKVVQSMWRFLSNAGLMSEETTTFKQQLFDLWFSSFSRGSIQGSSGFESVFIGETKQSTVIGLNNWFRFYLLEQAGQVNYHGWISREKGVQMELQFAWGSNEALIDSFLIGTAPEFDIAAYTICALANITECRFDSRNKPIVLTANTIAQGGRLKIESVYAASGSVPATKKPISTTERPPYPPSKLQELVDAMRAADEDKPVDYKLDWGNPVSGSKDTSPNPLFAYLNEDLFKRPQYAALIQIYEHELFTPDVCVAEKAMGGFRKQYIKQVFDIFTNTTLFQLAFKYLQETGVASDWPTFSTQLWTLWFGTYSRCKSPLGSSGWEHVFIGEWKSTKVDGQHSWVKYYHLEKEGAINYHGYQHYDEQLTGTFQYKWDKYMKSVGGFNIGTSPAFDFSIFSVCALTTSGKNSCRFNIDNYPISVTSFTQACADGTCLSTVYPAD